MSFLDTILTQAQTHLEHTEASSYLRARGVPLEQARQLGIGYFPKEVWPPRVVGEGVDASRWCEWSSNGYRLKGKLIFPITNALGKVRGLQLRSPDPAVKDYSKFYLEKSGIDAIFFGTHLVMPHIWSTRTVYLCEGLFDLPPLLRVFPNTLCAGTANVSRNQIEFLRRYVDTVIVAFDTDWGGERFWREFQEKYGRDFTHTARMKLPAKDPSELWARLGEEKFQQELLKRGAL